MTQRGRSSGESSLALVGRRPAKHDEHVSRIEPVCCCDFAVTSEKIAR